MPQDNERALYARELMLQLDIPVVQLGDLLEIQPTRVSEFRNGRPQPAALQNKIANAIYRVSKVWHGLGHSVPLCDLENAEAKLEHIRLLEDFNKNQKYRARLEAELVKRKPQAK